jgi:hypothetical protein
MTDEELKKVFSLLKGFVSHGCTLVVYFNDTKFEKVEIKSMSDFKKIKKITGGGGSVFKNVIEEAVKKNGFTILYSDLYIDTESINKKVIVVVPKENYDKQAFDNLKTMKFVI